MKVSWRITILIISINIVGFTLGSTNYTCNYIQNDVFEWNPQIYINKTCLNTTQCKRLYLIASINMPPYSLMDIVHRRLVQCCSCFNFLYPGQGGSYFRNTTELSSKAMERFDLIFPIAGHVKKQTSYGRYFIPLIEIPDYTYITHSLPTIGENMMESLKKVLPLTVICILMTIVSGFITWICETWYNSKEFPRPLITGWFEGTWWSFISMTTVGYGDKTPRSCPGRIFAIGWILIGITMFGILTGLLTTAIDSAQNPSAPVIKDNNVGILKYRTLDLFFVTENGGNKVNTNGISFEDDLIQLISYLKDKKIDGIILDTLTYKYVATILYATWKRQNFTAFGDKSESARKCMEFLRNDAAKWKKTYTGDKMAYGVLVKDPSTYTYFRDAFIDNQMLFVSEIWLQFSIQNLPVVKRINLFDISSPYFIQASWILATIVGGFLVIGIVIEVFRKSGACQLKSDSIDVTERNENAISEF